jgi:hypothetical protein
MYNQLLGFSTKYEANTSLARTFPFVITTSMLQDFNEENAGIDCALHCLSIALYI